MAGLVDWFGIAAPAVDDLVGARLITWGTAHVKSISATSDGVGLTGAASTDWNGVAMVSHRGGGQVAVYVNGAMRGPATASEAMDMPVLATWGLTFVRALAERRLAARTAS